MIIMLSYDLNGHERPSAYAAVKGMIEDRAVSYKRPLYSQWFIETDETVQYWHDRIAEIADSNDRWFISEVTRPRTGWLAKSVWTWLNERI